MTNMVRPSKPNRNKNGEVIQTTTNKSSKITTINSFWNEWSATKPTNLNENEIDRHSAHTHAHNLDHFHGSNEMLRHTTPTASVQTTTPKNSPDIAPWMEDILNEYYSSTTTARPHFDNYNNNNGNQNKFEYHTTSRTLKEDTDLLTWMREVLNEYATTTKRNRFENNNDTKQTTFDGGSGVNNNGDLHPPKQNRYSM